MDLNPGSDTFMADILWTEPALQPSKHCIFYENHSDYVWRAKSQETGKFSFW